MKYDNVLTQLGEFGYYQKWMYFTLCLPIITCGMHVMCTVFILGVPEHRCAVPSLLNDSFQITSDYHRSVLNVSVPIDETSEDNVYDMCRLIGHNHEPNATHNYTTFKYGCMKWVYDKSVFESTFVTEEDLVCGRKSFRTYAVVAFMAGFTAGALALGIVGDAFGRKKALMVSIVLHIFPNVALSFIEGFLVFISLRFLSGVSVGGLLAITFCMSMELVGPTKRMWAGILNELFWAFGCLLLALLAYFIRNWRYLNLAVSAPTIAFLSYAWIVPESARWLLTKGRDLEAEKILRKAAKINKVELPEKLFDYETFDSEKCIPLWKICGTLKLTATSLIIFVNWMVVSMVFYGLGLNVGNLAGNIYINFFLSSVAEMIGFVLPLIFLNRIGRKPVYAGGILVGGVACILTIFPVLYGSKDQQWGTISLWIVGRIGASMAFATIYLFSAEIFPTILRNSAMGVSSFCARIGGMLAPYITTLGDVVEGDFSKALPLMVFGMAAILVGILAMCLPETLGKPLPESIEDSIRLGKKQSLITRSRKITETSDAEFSKPLKTSQHE